MGDKVDKNKHKKKLTTKEKKAANHLRLMEGSKGRNEGTPTATTVSFNKDKKAA